MRKASSRKLRPLSGSDSIAFVEMTVVHDRARRVDDDCIAGDDDGLFDGADADLEINRDVLSDFEHDVLARGFGEALSRNGYVNGARWDVRHGESAFRIGRGRPRDAVASAGHRDGSRRHGRALRVPDRADDRCRRNLALRHWSDDSEHQKARHQYTHTSHTHTPREAARGPDCRRLGSIRRTAQVRSTETD